MSLVVSPVSSALAGLTPQLHFATREAMNSYGHKIDFLSNPHRLFKFGDNLSVSTENETVWRQGGIEDYPTANTIDSVQSTGALDTQTCYVEGFTVDGSGDFTRVTQTVGLIGIAPATLATPLARVERLINIDSTEFLGIIYVSEAGDNVAGVPQDSDLIHLKVPPEGQQSQKCSWSTAKNEYCLITGGTIGVFLKQSNQAQFRFKLREKGGVFRSVGNNAAAALSGSIDLNIDPYILIPPSSDVRIDCDATGDVSVQAYIQGYYAEITNL